MPNSTLENKFTTASSEGLGDVCLKGFIDLATNRFTTVVPSERLSDEHSWHMMELANAVVGREIIFGPGVLRFPKSDSVTATSALTNYPGEYAHTLRAVLEKRCTTNELGPHLLDKQFLYPDGKVILVAPFEDRRSPERRINMLTIVGKGFEIGFDCSDILRDISAPGALGNQSLIVVEEAECFRGTDEPFIPSEFIKYPGSHNGPSILYVKPVHDWFKREGDANLNARFASSSADAMTWLHAERERSYRILASEYCAHEVGHQPGVGIAYKVENQLLQTMHDRHLEEFISDWRAFAIIDQLPLEAISKTEIGQIIMSNFSLRFGVDAFRTDGMKDVDVGTTLYTYALLRENGLLVYTDQGLEFTFIPSDSSQDKYQLCVAAVRPLFQQFMTFSRVEAGLELGNPNDFRDMITRLGEKYHDEFFGSFVSGQAWSSDNAA